MKQITSRFPILRLAICLLFISSANQRVHAQDNKSSYRSSGDPGRLFIKRSPVLGHNVSVTIMMNGELASPLAWGHTYDQSIRPGRHVLTVIPGPPMGGAWETTLDVRPGQTYAYSISYNGGGLVLTPLSPRLLAGLKLD